MSRHEIEPLDPKHRVTVGWDHPMQTFFIQVVDHALDDAGDNDDYMILWKGASMRELYEVEDLERIARRYAKFTPEIGAKLYGDKDEGR